MNPPRLLTRFLLAAAAVLATAVGFLSLRQLGGLDQTAWATLAAVLAVVAATVSAWTGQRLVELQEDALAPNVQIAFDARRRYGLIQLCMTNRGLSPAHNIKIEWDNAPTNDKGAAVELGSGGVVAVLNPGEEASVAVNVAHRFFDMGEPLVFYGRLSFNDASGNGHSKQLVVSAEHERRALLHQSEEPKTLYELQRLPDKLDAIAKELRSLRDVVDRWGPAERE